MTQPSADSCLKSGLAPHHRVHAELPLCMPALRGRSLLPGPSQLLSAACRRRWRPPCRGAPSGRCSTRTPPSAPRRSSRPLRAPARRRPGRLPRLPRRTTPCWSSPGAPRYRAIKSASYCMANLAQRHLQHSAVDAIREGSYHRQATLLHAGGLLSSFAVTILLHVT